MRHRLHIPGAKEHQREKHACRGTALSCSGDIRSMECCAWSVSSLFPEASRDSSKEEPVARKAMAPTAEELFASYVVRRNARLRMTQLGISLSDCARMIGISRQSFHEQFNAGAVTPNTILLLSACLVVTHKNLLSPHYSVLHEPMPANGWQEIVSELLQESIIVTAPGTEHDFCCAVLRRSGLAACPVCNGQRRCGRDEKVCQLCFGGSQR